MASRGSHGPGRTIGVMRARSARTAVAVLVALLSLTAVAQARRRLPGLLSNGSGFIVRPKAIEYTVTEAG